MVQKISKSASKMACMEETITRTATAEKKGLQCVTMIPVQEHETSCFFLFLFFDAKNMKQVVIVVSGHAPMDHSKWIQLTKNF